MNFKSLIFLFLLGIGIMVISCNQEDNLIGPNPTDVEEDIATSFDEQIQSLNNISYPPPNSSSEVINEEQEGDYLCTTRRTHIGRGLNERVILLSDDGDVFVGQLFHGESVRDGIHVPIRAERKPITISTAALVNEDASASVEVQNPTLSGVRNATNTLLYNIAPNSTPASISFNIKQVTSVEEAQLEFGIDVSSRILNINYDDIFQDVERRTTYVASFYQKYYTINMNAPQKPSDLFEHVPDLSVFGEVSPIYVSSVTYGRMVYFLFASSYSAEETKDALEASLRLFGNGIGGDLTNHQKEIINTSSTRAVVVGGSSESATGLINGVEGFKTYIKESANFSKDSPGVPIAYKLKSLKDNTPTNLVLQTSYTTRECVFKGEEVIADIDPAMHYFCPEKVSGLLDRYDNGVEISGCVTLFTAKNDKEVWARVDVLYDSNDNNVQGRIQDALRIWTAPDNKAVAEIGVTNPKATFRYVDTDDEEDYGPNGDINITDGDFINQLRIVGDAQYQDFPCKYNNDSRSNFQISFKSFPVVLRSM